MGYKVYLDDVRTPIEGDWIVVRDYDEFVKSIKQLGLGNISLISLDHDLGESAMEEYFNNVEPNFELDYSNIKERTGLDCVKWLINHFYDLNPTRLEMSSDLKKKIPINFPMVTVHSANPIGSSNMMGYINNFLKNERQPESCIRVKINHSIN